jgi:4-amino-4-deoxy-L-arabinose transferase-like glycosyltransferase
VQTVDEAAPTAAPEVPALGDDPSAFVLGGSGGLRRRDQGAVGTWLGIGFVLVLVAIPLGGLYRFTGGTMEEGFMLYFPERMAAGDVPNVDFLHLYGPGSLHVLRWWYEVFGYSLPAERTFGLIQHLGIIFGLFTLARAWGRAAATCVAALAVFYVVTPIALTAMAWNGGLALTLWSAVFALRGISLEGKRRRWAWIVAGFLAGLALTYRPDLIVAVGLVAGWLAWKESAARRPLLLGAVVGLVPMWVHLVAAGPAAAWDGMIVDPVFRLRAGRELPRPPSWDHVDGALQAIAEEIPPWWRVPHLSPSHALFLWFFATLAGVVLLIVYAVTSRRRPGGRTGRSTVVLLVALISIGILPQALQRPDSTHLTWVTCVSWPFAIVVVAELVQRLAPRIQWRNALAAGALTALAATYVFTALFTFRYYLLHTRVALGQVPRAVPVTRDDRTFYFGSARAAVALQQAVDDLAAAARPGERLFVGPLDLRRTWYSDTVVYWMFPELEPATYYLEMDPGLANTEDSGLAADVASADWAVLTGFWAGWYEPNTSIDFGSDAPNQVIRDHFCEDGSYEDGLVVVYHRCR